MNKFLSVGLAIIVLGTATFFLTHHEVDENKIKMKESSFVSVTPISHATAVLDWGGVILYTDPVGGAEAFLNQPHADMILVTDIHGDHLSAETLQATIQAETKLIAPQAVIDELPEDLASKAMLLANGQKAEVAGFMIEAIPMYNLPESDDTRHTKGRGNGYVIEKDGHRVYIAGDTADIPEMRALQNIDIAFVPMNLPYTMDPDMAADAVLEFKPKQVYPYHYRQPDGFADVNRFKELVNAGDSNIEVILLDWYKQ